MPPSTKQTDRGQKLARRASTYAYTAHALVAVSCLLFTFWLTFDIASSFSRPGNNWTGAVVLSACLFAFYILMPLAMIALITYIAALIIAITRRLKTAIRATLVLFASSLLSIACLLVTVLWASDFSIISQIGIVVGVCLCLLPALIIAIAPLFILRKLNRREN